MSDPAPSAHIEQAKSGRAKCRRCRQVIPKGELRLGELVDNPYGEGQASLWYHVRCAAIKRPQALLAALAGGGEHALEAESERALAEAGAAHPALCSLASVEAAPSGRARCQHCHELIEKGTLRISRHNEADLMGIPTTSFIHLACISDYVAAVDLAAQSSDAAASDAEAEPAVSPKQTGPADASPPRGDAERDLRRCLRLHLIYHAEIHPAEHRDAVMDELNRLYPPTP